MMKPEKILSYPARVLTQEQREHYFEKGYVGAENLITEKVLAEILAVTDSFINASRTERESGNIFDIGPGHTEKTPVLRRIKMPDDAHEVYWRFASETLADIAADLAGPNVVFHHSKLNFKWFDKTDRVKWHQDIQFFPHTNYNVFTIGCYLADTNMTNGPLAVMPGSHLDPLFDQYDDHGRWTGMLSEKDAASLDMRKVEYITGKAGTLTIHNCRTLHFSPASQSSTPRPLLLNCFASADSKPYTPHPDPSSHAKYLICGEEARWADHDPRPCQIPPDWSDGYTSIYAAQSGEDQA